MKSLRALLDGPMTRREEREALCQAMWLDGAISHGSGIDWNAVVRTALDSGVHPTVNATLCRAGYHEKLAPELLAELQGRCSATAAANGLLLSDLSLVAQSAEDIRARVLALKGASLLVEHYPSSALRHQDDIDLLVEPDAMVPVVERLLQEGFRLFEHLHHDGTQVDRPLASEPVVVLLSPSEMLVELHAHLPWPLREADTFEGLWARARTRDPYAGALRFPHVEDLAAHLCAHVIGKHGDTVALLPRHLVDMRLLFSDSGPALDALLKVAEDAAAPVGLETTTALLRDLGMDLRMGRSQPLGTDPTWFLRRSSARALRGFARDRVLRVLALARQSSRDPRSALRALVPSPDYVAATYGVDRRSRQLPLLYARRLLRFLSPG